MSKLTYHNDELDKQLEEKLNLIQPTMPRDPEIVRHRRNEFIREVQYLRYDKPKLSIVGLLKNKPWQSLISQRSSFVPFAAAVFLIISLVFGSVGTVYAAQDSLPNDQLYSIKLAGEYLQLTLTRDTGTKILLLTSYTNRRVEEATMLVAQGEPIPENFTDVVDEYLEELFILTASLDEASAQETLRGIQIHLHDRDQEMTNAMNGLPKGLDTELVKLRSLLKARQQLALIGLENPNSFQIQQQFKYQHGQPSSPTSDTIIVTTTLEITNTLTITPGHYRPDESCDEETADCAPFGDIDPFGPINGLFPVFEDHRGYGSGSDERDSWLRSSETPASGDLQKTPPPVDKDHTNNSKDKDGGASKKGK